jgi:hypothetical protein
MSEPEGTKWDAFLSHAHEDKLDFVRPLADRLRTEGMGIWFDEFEIGYGQSISQSIERGLANSRVGIIIISQSSLKKNWTKYEISALKNLYLNYGTRLVPVWKDIDQSTIKLTDPGLLDIRALVYKGRTVEEVAYEIIAVIRPDILSRINSRQRKAILYDTTPIIEIDSKRIAPGPRLRQKIPSRDISRIRLLHSIFFDVFRDTVEDWIDNFCRDADYEDEILFWELVATFYLSWVRERRYSSSEKRLILRTVMELVQQASEEKFDSLLDKLPEHMKRPLSKKIDEWNADFDIVRRYAIDDLADHPDIRSLLKIRQNLSTRRTGKTE